MPTAGEGEEGGRGVRQLEQQVGRWEVGEGRGGGGGVEVSCSLLMVEAAD